MDSASSAEMFVDSKIQPSACVTVETFGCRCLPGGLGTTVVLHVTAEMSLNTVR